MFSAHDMTCEGRHGIVGISAELDNPTCMGSSYVLHIRVPLCCHMDVLGLSGLSRSVGVVRFR